MHLFPNTELLIETEHLLSSTTYPSDGICRCAYCHEPVMPDMVDYKRMTFQTYRCSCPHAAEESQLKELLIDQLEQLQTMKNHMDFRIISTAIYNHEMKRLRQIYQPQTIT